MLWDSCFDATEPAYDSTENKWIPNPGVQHLGPDFWPAGEHYCRALADALRDEPGLLMWDVMNEPTITQWVRSLDESSSIRAEREQRIWAFVRHFCGVMKRIDPVRPITVGVAHAGELPEVSAHIDVLSFHDYRPDRAAIRAHLQEGLAYARRFGKPMLISETACLARANPYDVALEACQRFGVGWYLWELMIGASRWRAIHGVVYPDGTVRDPSIVAAVQGFFRRRSGAVIPPEPDEEGLATRITRALSRSGWARRRRPMRTAWCCSSNSPI